MISVFVLTAIVWKPLTKKRTNTEFNGLDIIFTLKKKQKHRK